MCHMSKDSKHPICVFRNLKVVLKKEVKKLKKTLKKSKPPNTQRTQALCRGIRSYCDTTDDYWSSPLASSQLGSSAATLLLPCSAQHLCVCPAEGRRFGLKKTCGWCWPQPRLLFSQRCLQRSNCALLSSSCSTMLKTMFESPLLANLL